MNPVTRKEKPAGTFETGSLLDEAMEDRERDNYEDVIAALEEAARLDPTDPAVHYELGLCYGGACGKHSLYNPELALKHLRAALEQNDAFAAPVLQARILGALGNAYVAASPRHSASRLLAAIKCHRRAGAIYLQHHLMEDWARELFNEANDWCELPSEDYPEKWNEAVALYKKSLQVRTKQNDPEHLPLAVLSQTIPMFGPMATDRVKSPAAGMVEKSPRVPRNCPILRKLFASEICRSHLLSALLSSAASCRILA